MVILQRLMYKYSSEVLPRRSGSKTYKFEANGWQKRSLPTRNVLVEAQGWVTCPTCAARRSLESAESDSDNVPSLSVFLPLSNTCCSCLGGLCFNWIAIDQYNRLIRLHVPMFLKCFLRRLTFRFFFIFVVTSLVRQGRIENIPLCDSEDQEKPEQVDSLQDSEEGECDDLRDPAFVLLGFPIKFKGAHGAEFCKRGPENAQA